MTELTRAQARRDIKEQIRIRGSYSHNLVTLTLRILAEDTGGYRAIQRPSGRA